MRGERVLHWLDGVRAAVTPQTLLATGEALLEAAAPFFHANRGVPTDRMFVLALDAGGILPGVALSLAADLPMRIAWKVHIPLDSITFREEHAQRPDVFVYGLRPGDAVLIVDDEATTGATLANLVQALHEAGVQPLGAVVLAQSSSQLSVNRLADLGVPLVSLTDFDSGVGGVADRP